MPDRFFPPLRNLSPSRLEAFASCPLQFRYDYLMGMRGKQTEAQVLGTSVHSAVEKLYELQPAERTPEVLDDLAQAVASESEFGFDPAFVERARSLAAAYLQMEDPTLITPSGVEVWMEAELTETVILRGVLDRLDMSDEQIVVVDLKSGKSPSERFMQKALRPAMLYAWMVQQTLGRLPDAIRLLYLKDRREVSVTPTVGAVNAAVGRARAALDAIERASITDDFRPSPSKLCDWCDHKPRCPAHGGVKVEVTPVAATA